MRLSQLLFKTEKAQTSDAILPSHRLLLRTGFIKQVSAGIYSLSPLAHRVIRNISEIVREEMNRVGGQEVLLPVTQPRSLWEESERYSSIDSSLVRFKDRNKQDMVLAMTHEEAVTDMVRSFLRSYRQLPVLVYQVQMKFRDEARPRAGLIRLREFLMKDAYSFHTDEHSLNVLYDEMIDAYETIYRRCGVNVVKVESDTGMMGGGMAHEFMAIAEGGEDTLIICSQCDYAANREVATAKKVLHHREDMKTMVLTSTPDVSSGEAVAKFLEKAPSDVLKCVLYMARNKQLVLACILGHEQINEIKLAKLLNLAEGELRPMTISEAESFHLVPGSVSPIGLEPNEERIVVVDEAVTQVNNLIAGANQVHHHFEHVNYDRDFTSSIVGDITEVQSGQLCVKCNSPLEAVRGIEVGNIFKLGVKYSRPMNANFTTKEGLLEPMIMGCYGIGITRMLATIIEKNHDDRGIIWPASVAPYTYHLISIGSDGETRSLATEVYEQLGRDHVLFDDREATAGVKFTDADLLGIPLRITVSPRSIGFGGVEVQIRRTGQTEIVPAETLANRLEELIKQL